MFDNTYHMGLVRQIETNRLLVTNGINPRANELRWYIPSEDVLGFTKASSPEGTAFWGALDYSVIRVMLDIIDMNLSHQYQTNKILQSNLDWCAGNIPYSLDGCDFSMVSSIEGYLFWRKIWSIVR